MDKETREAIEKAFGFDEVKEALDSLVASATVGGKKEKKEEPKEDKAFKEAVNDIAKVAYGLYEAFSSVGFDYDQSFALALEMIRSFNQRANK